MLKDRKSSRLVGIFKVATLDRKPISILTLRLTLVLEQKVSVVQKIIHTASNSIKVRFNILLKLIKNKCSWKYFR